MERCRLLTMVRGQVKRKELLEWKSRYARDKKEKEKGPAGPVEKQEDKLETFFFKVHEFHNPVVTTRRVEPSGEIPRL